MHGIGDEQRIGFLLCILSRGAHNGGWKNNHQCCGGGGLAKEAHWFPISKGFRTMTFTAKVERVVLEDLLLRGPPQNKVSPSSQLSVAHKVPKNNLRHEGQTRRRQRRKTLVRERERLRITCQPIPISGSWQPVI